MNENYLEEAKSLIDFARSNGREIESIQLPATAKLFGYNVIEGRELKYLYNYPVTYGSTHVVVISK